MNFFSPLNARGPTGVRSSSVVSSGRPSGNVLVTIPAHNEAKFLTEAVRRVRTALVAHGVPFVLSIAEDGSTDASPQILSELRAEYPDLLVRSVPRKLGRGRALRELWTTVDAAVYAFIDADLASDPQYLLRAIDLVRGGGDVAIGSRYASGAVVSRPPLRSTVSQAYNWLLRTLLNDDIRDHQCGLKALSRPVVRTVLPLATEDSWFWDSEILVLAVRNGFKVAEFPVVWREMKNDRTGVSRLLSDLLIHGSGIIRLLDEVDRASSASRTAPSRSHIPAPSEPSDGSDLPLDLPVGDRIEG